MAYAVVFLAAFGAYSVLWRDAPVIQGDSLQYLEMARDLSDFRLDRLHDRAPGYPVLLVLTGSSHEPTRLLFQISLVLHFASIWLLAVVLHSAGVGRSWLLAFGGVLLLPSYVEPAAHVMTENLGQFTLVVGFACLMFWIWRRRPLALVVSALAFGGSTLTRPVYQALVLAVVGCLFLMPGVLGRVRFSSADVVRTSAALIAGSLLLVGAFSWLNYSKFGYFGVSPLVGFHLSTKTILQAERLPEEYAVVRDILLRERDAELVKRGSTHSGSQTIWEARAELEAATGLSTPELSRYLLRMNLALVRLAPIEYLQDVARSMSTYWFPAAGPLANRPSTAVRWLGTGIHFGVVSLFFLQLTVLAGLAVVGASRRLVGSTEAPLGEIKADAIQTMAFVLAGVIVFYTMTVTCLIDIGEPRQRRPTDVLFIFMCVLGAHVWCRTLSAFRPTERPSAAGCDATSGRCVPTARGRDPEPTPACRSKALPPPVACYSHRSFKTGVPHRSAWNEQFSDHQMRLPGTSASTTSVAQHHTGVMAQQSRWLLWVSLSIVVGAFLVRLPGIVEPMGPDQGVYVTIAWGLQRGLTLYRDLWEQKPPGIYLTYLLGFVLFGSRESSFFWLDYLAGALTTLLLFDLGRRLVNLRFGTLAAAVFALATLPAARHSYGGFLERAVTEAFITPLAAAAAWATVMAITRTRVRWSFAAGLFVGFAVVFKQTALIYWPALVLWTWWVTDSARARRFAIHSAIGAGIAPLLILLWLWSEGVLHEAWVAVVQYPVAYLTLGGEGVGGTLNRFAHEVWRRMKTDEVWALGSLSAVVALYGWRQWRSTRPSLAASLGVVWLSAAMVAIIANGPRMFMTYFLPSLIPLSLLIAWLLDRTLASGRRWRVAAGIFVLGLTGLMLVRSGSVNRAISVTRWDAQHLLGYTDRQEYLQRFRSRDGRTFSAAHNARLAEYVRTHTEPDDRIFVFGMTAATYFSSGRLPASRFLWVYPAVSNMIDRPEFRVETLAAELAGMAPTYIVLQRGNGDSFSGWRVEDSFAEPPIVALLRDYHPETEIGNFVLYRRNNEAPAPVTGALSRSPDNRPGLRGAAGAAADRAPGI